MYQVLLLTLALTPNGGVTDLQASREVMLLYQVTGTSRPKYYTAEHAKIAHTRRTAAVVSNVVPGTCKTDRMIGCLPTSKNIPGLGVGSWQYPAVCANHGIAALHPSRTQRLHREQPPTIHCRWASLTSECIRLNCYQYTSKYISHTTGFAARIGKGGLTNNSSPSVGNKDHPQTSLALMKACRP